MTFEITLERPGRKRLMGLPVDSVQNKIIGHVVTAQKCHVKPLILSYRALSDTFWNRYRGGRFKEWSKLQNSI